MKKEFIHFSLITFLSLLFINFQNFSYVDPEKFPIDYSTDPDIARNELLNKELKKLNSKCYEAGISCLGNRKTQECLDNKVLYFSKCSRISKKSLSKLLDYSSEKAL